MLVDGGGVVELTPTFSRCCATTHKHVSQDFILHRGACMPSQDANILSFMPVPYLADVLAHLAQCKAYLQEGHRNVPETLNSPERIAALS